MNNNLSSLKKQTHTCTHNQHHKPHLTALASQQFDPTHTLTLRNAFSRDAGKRFTELAGVVWRAIVDEDVFGLKPESSLIPTITVFQMTTPGFRAFDFPRSADKVTAFMDWLKQQENAGILEVKEFGQQFGVGIEEQWTDKYIESGYQKGIKQARMEMRKAGFNVPSIETSGGIEVVFNNPVHIDRVGLLFTRTFNELTGITNNMDQQISRLLSQGMAEGQSPNVIARWLTKAITGNPGDLSITDKLGRFIPARRRARMLARTEIIRSHAEGTLQEFQNFGVAGVEVRAELVTAGDSRVCAECEALEANIYTIQEARGIIPVHPSCVIGSTQILSNEKVINITKRLHKGLIVEIKTEDGLSIICTENHPILTGNGFVPASSLKNFNMIIVSRKELCKDRNQETQSIESYYNDFANLKDVEKLEIKGSDDFFHGDAIKNEKVTILHQNGIFDASFLNEKAMVDDIIDDPSQENDTVFSCVDSVIITETECYVYNLETSKGWFIANGIVTHNCRCAWLPKTVN